MRVEVCPPRVIVGPWKLLISQVFTEFVLQFCLPERFTMSASTVYLGALKNAQVNLQSCLFVMRKKGSSYPHHGKDVHNVHEVHGGIDRDPPIVFVLCGLAAMHFAADLWRKIDLKAFQTAPKSFSKSTGEGLMSEPSKFNSFLWIYITLSVYYI